MTVMDEAELSVAADFALGIGWCSKGVEQPVNTGPRLKDERREQLRDLFHAFDTDGSGSLSCSEISLLFKKLGMSADDTQELVREADKDGDGEIDLEEFVQWLYAKESEANIVLEYGDALKPLFEVFDRDSNGLVSREEFEECHSILQNALMLNPEDGDDHPSANLDPMDLARSSADIFAFVDKNGDGKLAFVEFAGYMQQMIIKSGISPEDLSACTQLLSEALEDVFQGIRMAESGEIPEDDPWALADRVAGLARATRTLRSSITASSDYLKALQAEQRERQSKWQDPPEDLSLSDAKMLHLKLHPLNARLIDKCTTTALCIPRSQDAWLVEISRTVQLKSKTERKDKPFYYRFETSVGEWEPDLREAAAAEFQGILHNTGRDMGVLCLLKQFANFGAELAWDEIYKALVQAVDIGWITGEQRVEFVNYTKGKLRDQMPAAELGQDAEASVHKCLQKHVMGVWLVMATLAKLSIVSCSGPWSAFVYKA